jgi:hypothetical protein
MHILWSDEDYHIAAGLQLLHGKMLYRDLWYDKPPLAAVFYAIFGAPYGIPLRLLGSAFVTAASTVVYLIACELWDRDTGIAAAFLLAFYLTFDLPVAIIPLAPDFLMILPHLAAIYLAVRGRPFAAGALCGIATLFNIKGVFVFAICAVVCFRSLPMLVAGFALPGGIALAWLGLAGALGDAVRQVWDWGVAYARSSPSPHPLVNGLVRTLHWMGFHALLVIAAAWFWWRERLAKYRWLIAWLLLSYAGVTLGNRFVARYFLQLLPVAVVVGARGIVLLRQARRPVLLLLLAALLVPVVRFAPRYFLLAGDLIVGREPHWSDIVLDQDSRAAAALVNAHRHAGDTLVVWGYRPDVYVYTRMTAASRFWDSQPLTGVPADRHLFSADDIIPDWAARNRREFARSSPDFVVDSLSEANPRLAIANYPALREWFARYRLVAQTPVSRIYELAR